MCSLDGLKQIVYVVLVLQVRVTDTLHALRNECIAVLAQATPPSSGLRGVQTGNLSSATPPDEPEDLYRKRTKITMGPFQ